MRKEFPLENDQMTGKLTVIGNNHPHDIVYWHELSACEQKELDYLDDEQSQDDFMGFRYKGNIYDLGEFMRAPAGLFPLDIDGYTSDSFFSGILVKYCEDTESVLVYTYIS